MSKSTAIVKKDDTSSSMISMIMSMMMLMFLSDMLQSRTSATQAQALQFTQAAQAVPTLTSELLEYDVNGNMVYMGEAPTGAPTNLPYWRIRKMTYDNNGNITSQLWAEGSLEFMFVWDNRTLYTYS